MNETQAARHDRRWWVLGIIAIAQLMVVLDATVVNVALPSAQAALHFSNDLRQWVVTAYALAFGSLLLVGGRIGDLFGRKWTFIGGAVGFAVASAVGGAAQSFGMLIAARAAQGVFAALLAPSALGMLTTTFTDGAERNKAFAVYSAIAASGSAIGLLLGGVLTQLLSWRYSLFVNLVFAVPAAVGGLSLLVNEGQPNRPSMDVPGTLTGPGGLFCLVYGFSNAETHSWGAALTIGMLAAAGVLLAAFVVIESRVSHPLLPLRVIAQRARGGSYLAVGLAGLAMLGAFLFLTYYLQRTLNDSPIVTGLSFLPIAGAIAISAGATNIKLRDRFGPRPLLTLGSLLGAGGLTWLAQLTPTSSYAGGVLPGLLLMGFGIGMVMGAAISTATYRVERQDAGVASAMVNTMQQVGGAIGTALLSTIFASALKSYAHGMPQTPQVLNAAAVHGYSVAFYVSAGIFAGGAILLAVIVPSIKANGGPTAPVPAAPKPQVPEATSTTGSLDAAPALGHPSGAGQLAVARRKRSPHSGG
jgi:EmrB/QacA subfamily drug resistance transporter